MLSLFRSLKIDELQLRLETAYRVIGLLLEGIRLHALCTSKELHSEFQFAITQLEQQIEKEGENDRHALMRITGATLHAMQEYAKHSDAANAARNREYQQLLVLLSRALAQALDGSDLATAGLQSIEHRLEGTSRADDIRVIKVELEGCLKAIHAECQRHQEQKTRLRSISDATHDHPLVATSFLECGEDPVTGLPSAAAAQSAIAASMEAKQDIYVAVLRLDSLQVVNARYGRHAGDRYLIEGSQLLAQGLTAEDSLYRWGGPCMVAIMRNRRSLDAARAEIDRLVYRTREHTITFDGRSVIFKVAISALCIRALQWPDAAALIAQIDAFANRDNLR